MIMERLTKRDWQVINDALTLLQAEHDNDEPDEHEEDLEILDAFHERQAQISDTRLKVHARLNRYKDPYA